MGSCMSSPAAPDAKRPSASTSSTTAGAAERKPLAASSSTQTPNQQINGTAAPSTGTSGLAGTVGGELGRQQPSGNGLNGSLDGRANGHDALSSSAPGSGAGVNGFGNGNGMGAANGSSNTGIANGNGVNGNGIGNGQAIGTERAGSDSQALAAALASTEGPEKRGSKDRSNAIDRQLEDDQRKFKKECKILLLGEWSWICLRVSACECWCWYGVWYLAR